MPTTDLRVLETRGTGTGIFRPNNCDRRDIQRHHSDEQSRALASRYARWIRCQPSLLGAFRFETDPRRTAFLRTIDERNPCGVDSGILGLAVLREHLDGRRRDRLLGTVSYRIWHRFSSVRDNSTIPADNSCPVFLSRSHHDYFGNRHGAAHSWRVHPVRQVQMHRFRCHSSRTLRIRQPAWLDGRDFRRLAFGLLPHFQEVRDPHGFPICHTLCDHVPDFGLSTRRRSRPHRLQQLSVNAEKKLPNIAAVDRRGRFVRIGIADCNRNGACFSCAPVGFQ